MLWDFLSRVLHLKSNADAVLAQYSRGDVTLFELLGLLSFIMMIIFGTSNCAVVFTLFNKFACVF